MRHTPTTSVLVVLAVLAAGCGGQGEPAASGSPTVASASPVPSATTSPSASPSPGPAAPAAEEDGCPPPVEQRTALPPPATAPTASNAHIGESPSGRPIDVELLVLEGSPAADQITSTVRSAVEDLVAEWDAVVGPPTQDDGDTPDPELQLQVTTTRVGAQLVSLRLDGYQYLGGASGDAVTDAWTFATATGEQLALADVGLDGPCLDELGVLAADALGAQEVGMFEDAEAALRAGEIPMQRWSVTDELLQVHFPEYEIAPGAAGAPVAEIPLTELRAATGTPLQPSG